MLKSEQGLGFTVILSRQVQFKGPQLVLSELDADVALHNVDFSHC